ncbi:UNVERIFIED_CONTAM: hypothetical protein Sradi_6968100 [Sesamum radiatum]|uniref:Uncharacterized protein n=1 Tax=Sesamum radiatum TaxID=300843 RepID=A0AAW2JEJ2_SESRA
MDTRLAAGILCRSASTHQVSFEYFTHILGISLYFTEGILKVIEGKMRKFLWQGPSGRGTAKVAWEQICKPKDEGGLGIRSTLASNQALMLKHLWRILQNDGTSIWLIGFSITAFETAPFGHLMVQQVPGAGRKCSN